MSDSRAEITFFGTKALTKKQEVCHMRGFQSNRVDRPIKCHVKLKGKKTLSGQKLFRNHDRSRTLFFRSSRFHLVIVLVKESKSNFNMFCVCVCLCVYTYIHTHRISYTCNIIEYGLCDEMTFLVLSSLFALTVVKLWVRRCNIHSLTAQAVLEKKKNGRDSTLQAWDYRVFHCAFVCLLPQMKTR